MKERIVQLMDLLGMNPTQFANAIGVQRTTIQHILSGRNEPSLKIVANIYQRFSNINLDWLLTGNGEPQISAIKYNHPDIIQKTLFNNENELFSDNSVEEFKNQNVDKKQRLNSDKQKPVDKAVNYRNDCFYDKHVKEIMVLYEDGTYELFFRGLKK